MAFGRWWRGVLTIVFVSGAVVVGAPASADTSDDSTLPAGRVQVTGAGADDADRRAAEIVAQMSLDDKAASVVMGHIAGTSPDALRAYMSETDIGGFILMGANIPASESALREITAALTLDPAFPPLIAVDQEGGVVSRLPWDDFPSSRTLKYEPTDATALAFAGRAALVQRAGISVNFGIVADVTPDTSMFIYTRELGTTPDAAAERVAAAVTGEGSEVFSTLKHFPGHGAAPGDSHAGIPETGESYAEWASSDALPFAAGIDAGAPLLMFGHLRYTAVDSAPASLSAEWHRIAREDLGFEGVAITDDLGMLEASGLPEYRDPVANAVAALAAGNDMVLTILYSDRDTAGRITAGIAAAVENGQLTQERLDEAATRVAALRLDAAAEGPGLAPCPECAPVG
ncbi:glycoside hydrolase family 3 N-terminal domain-containing protein [Microbacterium sediminicola]|uniref:Glycoside hydrolase family 3 N-terminal domain-containing protein n=1 Tax=Microbacterium sediminicola TaxID=415210 RepID=A0ABP4TS08_9MICO